MLKVTVCAAEAWPTVWLKLKAPGDTCATGVCAVPEPDKDTVSGPPAPLLATVSVPLRAPAALGTKPSPTVQLAPGATGDEVAQVPPLRGNSAEPVAIELSVRFAVPLLDTVTVCALAEPPSTTAPKLTLLVDTAAIGAGAAAPVPDRLAVTLPMAEATVRVALRLPTACGVKPTVTEQEPPAATGEAVEQVPPVVKSAGLLPLREMDDKLKAALPALLTVKVCAELAVVSAVEANVTAADDSAILAAAVGTVQTRVEVLQVPR